MQVVGRLNLLTVSRGRLEQCLIRALQVAGALFLSVMIAAAAECEPDMFGDSFDFPW
ncbi:hypothetical protein N182_21460 [Sinorhizobium sp. GL2]|nr:hypothetical protein N182_21460 [Sinorhizobium sp. GL2]